MTAVQCQLCGHEDHFLRAHLREEHGMSLSEYVEAHPDSPTVSKALLDHVAIRGDREPVVNLEDLQVDFGGVGFPLHLDVPGDACLPKVEDFVVPSKGAALKATNRLLRYLKFGRHTIVWGPSGSGKDAILSAWSWRCRCPGAVFQVRPETNIEGWLRMREITPERGSHYSEGLFLRLYRDGYEVRDPESGEVVKRVPCLLVLTDIDRATEEQMETFRLIMDSTSGRFVDPEGITHHMLPGTVIMATSNTIGGGDDTGLYRSARPQDASMMSRWKRAVKWHYLSWDDEVEVCKRKFPALVARYPHILHVMKAIVETIRPAITSRRVRTVFGHREVLDIMEDAWDLLCMGHQPGDDVLKEALMGVLDKSTDEANIQALKDLIDPHIPGDLYT